MSIETLTEWNERLEMCGCCPMPECSEPTVFCENNWASIDTANNGIGFTPEEGYDPLVDPLYYRRLIYHYEGTSLFGDGSITFTETLELGGIFDTTTCSGGDIDIPEVATTYSGSGSIYLGETFTVDCDGTPTEITVYDEWIFSTTPTGPNTYVYTKRYYIANDFCDPSALTIDIVNGEWLAGDLGSYFDVTETITYELPVTWADMQAEIPNLIDLASVGVDEECWYSPVAGCSASLELNTPGVLLNIKATALRFRFRIPIAHTGSKFFITYDIGEFPTEGDPSFVSQDNVIEWTGPGTGTQSDPSWFTDWVIVPPPEVAGERRVVNIRYTCYSGTKYGAKPQVMGEVLEIPPP